MAVVVPPFFCWGHDGHPTSQRPHFTGDGHTTPILKEAKDQVLLGQTGLVGVMSHFLRYELEGPGTALSMGASRNCIADGREWAWRKGRTRRKIRSPHWAGLTSPRDPVVPNLRIGTTGPSWHLHNSISTFSEGMWIPREAGTLDHCPNTTAIFMTDMNNYIIQTRLMGLVFLNVCLTDQARGGARRVN